MQSVLDIVYSYMYVANNTDQHIGILVSRDYECSTNGSWVLSKTPLHAIGPTRCSQQ